MTSSVISVKAHDDKCVAICYDESSNNVMSIGYDGTLCIWSGLTNNCSNTLWLDNDVNSMVYEKDRVFIASSSNTVDSFSTHKSNKSTVIAQFLTEVTYIRISKDKQVVVACSSDNTIKVIRLNAESADSRETTLTGHSNSVMSVDVSDNGGLAASASIDGLVIVWRTTDGSKLTEMAVLPVWPDVSQATNRCRLRFSPAASRLAVPLAGEIRVFDCEQFALRSTLRWTEGVDHQISEMIFSEDGRGLVAGTEGGVLLIFDVVARSFINSWVCPRKAAITSMLWHPQQAGTLLFADASGHWEAVKVDFKKKAKDKKQEKEKEKKDVLPTDSKKKSDKEKRSKKENKGDKDKLTLEEMEDMFEDFEDDEKSVATTVTLGSEDDEEEEEEDEFNLSRIKAQFADEDEHGEEEGIAAVPHVVQEAFPRIQQVAKARPHPPVRPGATPASDGVQLLLWNAVGAIKRHQGEDGEASLLEVVFHDCHRFRNLVLRPAVADCRLGDVNETAVLLIYDQTTDEDEDEDSDDDVIEEDHDNDDEGRNRRWTIVVQPSSPGATSPSWRVALPRGEVATACCLVGGLYAVVLMTSGLVRYFCLAGGIQLFAESLAGCPVAAVASPGLLAVVVETVTGGPLLCRVETLSGVRLVDRGRLPGSRASTWLPVPLSKGARLSWVGFSDGGVLVTEDSRQIVRRLLLDQGPHIDAAPRWALVADLVRSVPKDRRGLDSHFLVGISDIGSPRGALTILCKNRRTPSLLPWPHLSVVPLLPPLCAPQGPSANQEAVLMALSLIPVPEDEAQALADIQEERMALFNLFINALKEDEDARALAVAHLMRDSRTIQLSMQAALRQRKTALAERLGEIALQRDQEEEGVVPETPTAPEEDREEEQIQSGEKEPVKRTGVSAAEVQGLLGVGQEEEEAVVVAAVATPFKTGPRPIVATHRRGIEVLDGRGAVVAVQSPKRSALSFGTFVPASPGEKRFLVKTKAKRNKPGTPSPAKAPRLL